MKQLALLCTLASTPVLADDVKIDGRVETGFRVEAFERGRFRSELVAEIKSRREAFWRAEAEIRGRSDAKDVKLREAFLDYRDKGEAREFRIGQTKKILGLEYERGERSRPAPERAAIYRKLETMALVGRETVARYGLGDGVSAARHTLSLGYAEARDTDLIYAVQAPLGGDHHAGAWLLAQADRIEEKEQFVWATVGSYWYETDALWASAEFFAGKDPFESHYESLYGDAKAVHFAALKLEIAPLVRAAWQPFAQLSGILHDVSATGSNTLTAMAGVNRLWKDLKVAMMVEAVGTTSPLDRRKRDYDDSLAVVQGSYYF
jgi:hypothetical protein